MFLRRTKPGRRPAATLVESAVVLGVTLTTLVLLVVGGLGVARYQQVAHLARESARIASVIGNQYQGQPDAERSELYNNGTLRVPADQTTNPKYLNVAEVGLDPSSLTYKAEFPDGGNGPYQVDPGTLQAVGNRVQITLRYQWLFGITFSTTSEMQVTN